MFTFGVNIVKGIHILCALEIYVQNLDHKRVKYPFGIGFLVGVYVLGGYPFATESCVLTRFRQTISF